MRIKLKDPSLIRRFNRGVIIDVTSVQGRRMILEGKATEIRKKQTIKKEEKKVTISNCNKMVWEAPEKKIFEKKKVEAFVMSEEIELSGLFPGVNDPLFEQIRM